MAAGSLAQPKLSTPPKSPSNSTKPQARQVHRNQPDPHKPSTTPPPPQTRRNTDEATPPAPGQAASIGQSKIGHLPQPELATESELLEQSVTGTPARPTGSLATRNEGPGRTPAEQPPPHEHQNPGQNRPPHELDNATTAEQVETYLVNRYGLDVLGIYDQDLPVRPLTAFARGIDDVVTRHPDIELPRIVGVVDQDTASTEYAVTQWLRHPDGTVDPVALTLNRRYLVDPEKMRIAVENDMLVGFHPPGFERDPWYANTVHELGHVLDIQGNFRASDEAMETLTTYFVQHVARSSDPVRMDAEFRAWLGQLSGYSLRRKGDNLVLKRKEAVAEAFLDVEINGDRASEPAKILHRLLTESRRLK